ncbi:porin family protein [Flavobacterium sp. N3904]|uniref:porin family protein n=1 Tax=Flavobacterium sp. N3904 TaxID=2986835 RepID=UPI0022240334|nr:porin family protein [Flavobacterium sp. N3904]
MKKTLVILALAMISFANAQKGTVLVSGNMGFVSQKESTQSNDSKNKYVSFYPKVGYQFKDNWTLGIESGFSSAKNEYTSQESISKNFTAGAFVRYSKSLSPMFLLYADLGAGYQNRKVTDTYPLQPSSTFTLDGVYMNLTPGLFLNIKNNFGLNFGIGGLLYSDTKSNQTNGSNQYFYFNFGQSFTAGISKNF